MDIMALRDGYILINSRLSYSHYPFFRGTGRGVAKWVDGEEYSLTVTIPVFIEVYLFIPITFFISV